MNSRYSLDMPAVYAMPMKRPSRPVCSAPLARSYAAGATSSLTGEVRVLPAVLTQVTGTVAPGR